MEDSNHNNEISSKKRARVESDTDSVSEAHESKRVQFDWVSDATVSRVDSAKTEFDLQDACDVGNDILDILDGTDAVAEIQDLDSVIRSFEEEILHSAPASYTDESQPDLGYLLGASDDELGLPPATSPTDNNNISKNELSSYSSFEFENKIQNNDLFGFGFGDHYEVANEFVTVGGLFEYPEADYSEFLWRPESESLPAV